jgi:hypothetical protein
VQVGLVHFVGEKNEGIFLAEMNEHFLSRFVEKGASRIARIDDNKRCHFDTILLSSLDGRFNFGY